MKAAKALLAICFLCLAAAPVAFADTTISTSLDVRGNTDASISSTIGDSTLLTTLDTRGKMKIDIVCVPYEYPEIPGITCTQVVSARGRGTYIVNVGEYALQPDFEFKTKKITYNEDTSPLENDQIVLEYRGHFDGEGEYTVFSLS